jgi:hypothetical protein
LHVRDLLLEGWQRGRVAAPQRAIIPIEIVITGLDDPVIILFFLRRLMDARIKSGHDECVLRGEVEVRFTHTNFNFQQPNDSRHDFSIPRRDAPELCINLPPIRRAWGMPGARCTRDLVCTLYW